MEQCEHNGGADNEQPPNTLTHLSERLDAQPNDVPAGDKPNDAGH